MREVRKRYGRVVAVDGLSLEIGRPGGGEDFGLLGPNGAGKSTTIGMMAGLIEPDGGEVEVRLEGVGRWSPRSVSGRRRLGVCPQSIALYTLLTARENLVLLAKLAGLDRRAARARAGELLELVGLGERANHRVRGFSGGMQRRLNFAAALVHDPAMVLLDEPTAGVDPHSRAAMFDLVRGLRERGRTVLYSTHYMEEAQRLCDRVAIIDRGRLLEVGTVDELIARAGGATTVRVERADGVEAVQTSDPLSVVAQLDLSGVGAARVMALRIEPPDLERVFLSLTGRSLRDGGERTP